MVIMNSKRGKKTEKGSALIDVILFGALTAFVVLPVVSFGLECYVLIIKGQAIQDAVDLAVLSTFGSLENVSYGETEISFDMNKLIDNYRHALSNNLSLDEGLNPEDNSVLCGQAVVEENMVYDSDLPVNCPEGKLLKRPSIHMIIRVPIKPAVCGAALLELTGRQSIEFRLHIDSELPINN